MTTEDPDSKKKAVRVAQSSLSNTTNEWIDEMLAIFEQDVQMIRSGVELDHDHILEAKLEIEDRLFDFRNTVIDECIAWLGGKHPDYMNGDYSRGRNEAITEATENLTKLKETK